MICGGSSICKPPNLARLTRLHPDIKQGEKGYLTIDNINAKWIIYSYTYKAEQTKGLMYVLVKGRRGYEIGATAPSHLFDKNIDKLKKIMQSFKFE